MVPSREREAVLSMSTEAERANITRWGGGPGHYEVYYVKFNHRDSGTAFWIRYTLLAPLHGPAETAVWGIFFDAHAPSRNVAIKNSFPMSASEIKQDRFFFRVGEASIDHAGARGRVRDTRHVMEWDLGFGPVAAPFFHFPLGLMYRTPVPKTKVVSPNLSVRVRGRVAVDGRVYTCEGEPGQQTHLWGTKHAEQWTWASCNSFKEDDTAIFEGLSARIRLGTRPVPALTILLVRCAGREYRLNGLAGLFRNKSNSAFPVWRFAARQGSTRIEGRVGADTASFVGVEYTDPDGERLWCYNTEVADMELSLYDKDNAITTLTSSHACAIEFADRVRLPDIPIRI